jgi:hypothetical protein
LSVWFQRVSADALAEIARAMATVAAADSALKLRMARVLIDANPALAGLSSAF